jgi:hypothetical protein
MAGVAGVAAVTVAVAPLVVGEGVAGSVGAAGDGVDVLLGATGFAGVVGAGICCTFVGTVAEVVVVGLTTDATVVAAGANVRAGRCSGGDDAMSDGGVDDADESGGDREPLAPGVGVG